MKLELHWQATTFGASNSMVQEERVVPPCFSSQLKKLSQYPPAIWGSNKRKIYDTIVGGGIRFRMIGGIGVKWPRKRRSVENLPPWPAPPDYQEYAHKPGKEWSEPSQESESGGGWLNRTWHATRTPSRSQIWEFTSPFKRKFIARTARSMPFHRETN